MNSPNHFRFLNDHVEETARRTPAILSNESRHFWDDILEASDQREDKRGYWIFATRWVRETLVGVMHRGSVRALRSILKTLNPDLETGTPVDSMNKRVVVSHLLPILMRESVAKIEAAAALRYGPAFQDAPPTFHPEDHER